MKNRKFNILVKFFSLILVCLIGVGVCLTLSNKNSVSADSELPYSNAINYEIIAPTRNTDDFTWSLVGGSWVCDAVGVGMAGRMNVHLSNDYGSNYAYANIVASANNQAYPASTGTTPFYYNIDNLFNIYDTFCIHIHLYNLSYNNSYNYFSLDNFRFIECSSNFVSGNDYYFYISFPPTNEIHLNWQQYQQSSYVFDMELYGCNFTDNAPVENMGDMIIYNGNRYFIESYVDNYINDYELLEFQYNSLNNQYNSLNNQYNDLLEEYNLLHSQSSFLLNNLYNNGVIVFWSNGVGSQAYYREHLKNLSQYWVNENTQFNIEQCFVDNVARYVPISSIKSCSILFYDIPTINNDFILSTINKSAPTDAFSYNPIINFSNGEKLNLTRDLTSNFSADFHNISNNIYSLSFNYYYNGENAYNIPQFLSCGSSQIQWSNGYNSGYNVGYAEGGESGYNSAMESQQVIIDNLRNEINNGFTLWTPITAFFNTPLFYVGGTAFTVGLILMFSLGMTSIFIFLKIFK